MRDLEIQDLACQILDIQDLESQDLSYQILNTVFKGNLHSYQRIILNRSI